jgi:hypothetical protein
MLIPTFNHHLFRPNRIQLPGSGNGVRLRISFCGDEVQRLEKFSAKFETGLGGR